MTSPEQPHRMELAQAWEALGLPRRLPATAPPAARVQHRIIGLLLRQVRAALAVPATAHTRQWKLGWVSEGDLSDPIDAAHPPKRFVWLHLQDSPSAQDVAEQESARPLYRAIEAKAPWPRQAPEGLEAGLWADEAQWRLDEFQAALPPLDPDGWCDLGRALAEAARAVPDPLRAWSRQHVLRAALDAAPAARPRPRF